MTSENSVAFNSGTFRFSGTNLNDLESAEYTLVSIALDTSYSVSGFKTEMTNALKEVIRSCQKSPRSDNLLVRLLTFDTNTQEFHGYKELNKCVLSDYDNIMSKLGNSTSLFDGAIDAIESLNIYGKELFDNDYTVNGLSILITDGDDNSSTYNLKTLKQKMAEVVGEKKIESLVSILVGVNTATSGISLLLNNIAKETGMQYIDVDQADAKSLAKLAKFISRSISSQSTSLGTGAAAPSLTF